MCRKLKPVQESTCCKESASAAKQPSYAGAASPSKPYCYPLACASEALYEMGNLDRVRAEHGHVSQMSTVQGMGV